MVAMQKRCIYCDSNSNSNICAIAMKFSYGNATTMSSAMDSYLVPIVLTTTGTVLCTTFNRDNVHIIYNHE